MSIDSGGAEVEFYPYELDGGDASSVYEAPTVVPSFTDKKWWIDNVSLDTCAYAIQNRSAGWSVPSRRGDNYFVPGLDGSMYNDQKAFDEGSLVLRMFAAGTNPDGSWPDDRDKKVVVRENMDKLMRLFSKNGLMELVYAERGDYNRINLVPNPSLESATIKTVVRENIIQNPSGEYSYGLTVARRNMASNPSMNAAEKVEVIRRNLLKNPRMAGESEPVQVRRNRIKNPSFESGTRFAKAVTNSRIVQVNKTRRAQSWPVVGRRSLRVASQGTGAYNFDMTTIRVDAGEAHTFSAYVWSKAMVNRTYRITVRWYNANGGLISTTGATDQVIGPEGVQRISATYTAPGGAKSASMRVGATNSVNSDRFFIDAMMCTATSGLYDYFDGDQPENDSVRHRWTDDAGRSESVAYVVAPRGWTSDEQLGATTEFALRGSQSARVVLAGNRSANASTLLRTRVNGGGPVGPGVWVSAMISARLAESVGETRTVNLKVGCYDTQGTFLGVIKDASDVDVDDVNLELGPGEWSEVTVENMGKTLPKTAKVVLIVKNGESWTLNDSVYFDCAMVEPAKRLGDYFDGNIRDDDTFTYDWAGDPHWSISRSSGQTVLDWDVKDGYQYQSSDGLLGDYSLELQAYREPESTERPRIYAKVLRVDLGQKHSFSVWVKTNRTQNFKVGISTDLGTSYTYGSSTSCVSGTWTRVSVGNVLIDENVLPEEVRVMVTANSTPADNDQTDIDCALFESTEDIRDFFDGNSGEDYSWAGAEDRTVSRWIQPKANGWTAYGNGKPVIYQIELSDGTHRIRVVADESGELGFTFGSDGINKELEYSFGINLISSVSRSGVVGIGWYALDGTLISESTTAFTSSTSVSTRYAVVADPPSTAVVGAPFVRLTGVAAGETLDGDFAIFGFGDNTTFADGDSGSGWTWVDPGYNSGDFFTFKEDGITRTEIQKRWASESVQLANGVDYWVGSGGIFVQTDLWSSAGENAGTLQVLADIEDVFVAPKMTGKNDQEWFPLLNKGYLYGGEDSTVVTWAADVHANVDSIQARMEIRYTKWNGFGWEGAIGAASVVGDMEPITAGTTERLVLSTDILATAGDATHFVPVIALFESDGSPASEDLTMSIDRASLTRDLSDTYVDGSMDYVEWTGEENQSPSRVVGPDARRIWVERVAAIDATALGYGVIAEFSVQLRAPGAFWEDTKPKTQQLPIPRNKSEIRLDALEGSSAPINDARIEIFGPIKDFMITDVGSGAWIRINEMLKDPNESIIINCANWTVTRAGGRSVIANVTCSGGGALLPITTPNNDDVPRLRIEGDSIGAGSTIRVKATERYLIA